VAVFLGTLQFSVLVLALLLAAVRPSPGLATFLTSVLCAYLLVALALFRLTPEPYGVIGQCLALVAVACLRGGHLSVWAATSAFFLTLLYVGLDHHARLLAAHRIDDRPYVGLALRRTATLVLPVALTLGAVLARAVPSLVPLDTRLPSDEELALQEEKPKREMDTRALRAVVMAGVAGVVAVYFVGRTLIRSRRGQRGAIETPEPLRGRLERMKTGARSQAALPEYPGRRGRIVRAYLMLLRGAEHVGFPRRPSETPREFESALQEPAAPLRAVTELFVRARYGPIDLSDKDVSTAERGADAVLDRLQRRPPRRRREIVHDADAPPQPPDT
jgi:hypothetical protein